MTVAIHELIAECTRRGIHLELAGEHLRWQGPKEALTPELAGKLKEHKPELLKLVAGRWNPELAAKGYQWCFDCPILVWNRL